MDILHSGNQEFPALNDKLHTGKSELHSLFFLFDLPYGQIACFQCMQLGREIGVKVDQIIYRMRAIDMYQTFGCIIDPFHLPVGRINKNSHVYMIGKCLKILQFAFFLLQVVPVMFKGILHFSQQFFGKRLGGIEIGSGRRKKFRVAHSPDKLGHGTRRT